MRILGPLASQTEFESKVTKSNNYAPYLAIFYNSISSEMIEHDDVLKLALRLSGPRRLSREGGN